MKLLLSTARHGTLDKVHNMTKMQINKSHESELCKDK